VCATSKHNTDTVCLTSYRTPRGGNDDLLDAVTIWQACRATSAASGFFDPIEIGRYDEQFVDGATGANNPVREVWDQAELLWGAPLEGKLERLVSIGTGMPSMQPFGDYVLDIVGTLRKLATETENTAEHFRREKSQLASDGRYCRFNVPRGLENIGLEEAKRRNEIASATRSYVKLEEVRTQMLVFAGKADKQNLPGE
jgi:predicted acylesterase/phospholipase RssA